MFISLLDDLDTLLVALTVGSIVIIRMGCINLSVIFRKFLSKFSGAASVILTDKDTRPAQMNLEQNRPSVEGNDITTSKLEWGESVLTFNPPFDVILAADVIYIEEVFTELAQTLEDLSDSNSIVLLCCKRRYERDDRFFQQLLASGKFEDHIVKIWQGDITVHRLRRIFPTTEGH